MVTSWSCRAEDIVVITAGQPGLRYHTRHQVQLLTGSLTELRQNLRTRALDALLQPQYVAPGLSMFEQVVFRLKGKLARLTRVRPFVGERPAVSPSVSLGQGLGQGLGGGGRGHHAAHAVLESVPHILAGH